MAYELENIELKISENIALADSEYLNFDVPVFLQELDIECSKIKRAFKRQVVSFENDDLIRRYFHFHQESLIDLVNNLQSNSQPGTGSNYLSESIIIRLCGLLAYLEEHFPEYFDLDMEMPIASRRHAESELRTFIQSINEKFSGTNVDIGLIELVENAVEDLVVNSEGGISFRQYYYFKFLRNAITGYAIDKESDTLQVISVLMHCNFNGNHFYQYLIRYIGWAVNKAVSINEKIDQLALFLKFANQEGRAQNVAYDHLNVPINVQIADWISEEIQYLKHKQQLTQYTVEAEDAVPSDFKLSFDLSVSVLAYLFRTFIETGVIQNKNTSELIRFLTKYVRTKKSESISYDSFRIKYYSIENGTKDAVKKMLQSILSYINKN
ncbi:MAG TPA: hypothetical protein VFW11_22260 [Cyclobacteriaceae bacterium]|nr:hypothetical protein [Cyclobacteriaceae bacterium]